MFQKFLDLLSAETTQKTPQDERVGFVALLVRAAKVDDHYAPQEQAMIDQILSERYAPITGQDVADLRAEGERLEQAAADNVTLTRAVKASVPHEDRIAVIEALWRVVLSDDARDAEENAFLRLSVSLLGVSDQESGLARQRVNAQLSARPNR